MVRQRRHATVGIEALEQECFWRNTRAMRSLTRDEAKGGYSVQLNANLNICVYSSRDC